MAIPTGIPIVYKFDKNMVPIPPTRDEQTAAQVHMNGLFLEKPGVLKSALKRETEWCNRVPGYDKTMTRKFGLSPLERSLTKLQAERDLGAWAGKFVIPEVVIPCGPPETCAQERPKISTSILVLVNEIPCYNRLPLLSTFTRLLPLRETNSASSSMMLDDNMLLTR